MCRSWKDWLILTLRTCSEAKGKTDDSIWYFKAVLFGSIDVICSFVSSVHLRRRILLHLGHVTCLIAPINDANTLPGEHVINLEPGNYTLHDLAKVYSLMQMGYR